MFSVLIRKNETGEIRTHRVKDFDWDDAELFMWTDGNYACDCNRELFFERASGNDAEMDLWHKDLCGDSRFTAIKAILPDGSEMVIDD